MRPRRLHRLSARLVNAPATRGGWHPALSSHDLRIPRLYFTVRISFRRNLLLRARTRALIRAFRHRRSPLDPYDATPAAVAPSLFYPSVPFSPSPSSHPSSPLRRFLFQHFSVYRLTTSGTSRSARITTCKRETSGGVTGYRGRPGKCSRELDGR